MSDQENLHNAYRWIVGLYGEAWAMFEDLAKLAATDGYEWWSGRPQTGYQFTLGKDRYPFVYLAAALFVKPGQDSAPANSALLVAIDFHSARRIGPHLLAGTVRYDVMPAAEALACEIVNYAARHRGVLGNYVSRLDGDDITWIHDPIEGSKKFAAFQVTNVEIPLTAVDGLGRLTDLWKAARAFHDGRPEALIAFARLAAQQAGAPDGAPSLAPLDTSPRG